MPRVKSYVVMVFHDSRGVSGGTSTTEQARVGGEGAGPPKLIRGRIQSRHHNSTKYYIYVLVDVAKAGSEGVIGYCCQCKSGLRTVGCCTHIMTVLWYLGFGKYQPEIKQPAASLSDVCVVLDSTDSEME